MLDFKDNFSKQADLYAKYRPHYPTGLYLFLASLTDQHELAWDCGTGNGQAASSLATFYKQVIATDPSEQQIKNAIQNPNISYLVERAENTSIKSNSVDLLTIANALHWFDFDLFYKEVRRVLKTNGIIAAWCYGIPSVSPGIDLIVKKFNDEVLDPYWQAENRLVEKEYSTIPFPFELIESPSFHSEKEMNLLDFTGYFNTWSATQRFITKNGVNPTTELFKELNKTWVETDLKKLRWKLTLKVGRIHT